MTIDGRFCVTVQAISPVQEIGISRVGWAVFVTEPDRQQAIIVQCLSALSLSLSLSVCAYLHVFTCVYECSCVCHVIYDNFV